MPRRTATTHGRASRHASSVWLLSLQHDPAPHLRGLGSLVLLSLVIRGFVEPLFFLEITSKAFLSIKTQEFLLKVRQNTL